MEKISDDLDFELSQEVQDLLPGLREEHGEVYLFNSETFGPFLFRCPNYLEVDRLVKLSIKEEGHAKLPNIIFDNVVKCCLYPDVAEAKRRFQARPGLHIRIWGGLQDLARDVGNAELKKL